VIEELISYHRERLQLPYLPIALPKIVKAIDVLLREALGFAIMGRNLDLVTTLLHRISETKIEIIGFYPPHLAASYLDGVTSCCNILGELLGASHRLQEPESFQEIRDPYINNLGHTVLDT
jgi:hypothetical protein